VNLAQLLLILCFAWTPRSIATQDPPAPASSPAAPAQVTKRVKVGGNVAKSMLKRKVTPQYPREARDARTQGTVRLHVVLSTSGKVQQLDIVFGDPVLAEAAVSAVRKWEYKPFRLNGEPVEVDTTVDVVFSLVQ